MPGRLGWLIVQKDPRGLGPPVCSNQGSKRPWGWPYSDPRASRISGVNPGELAGPCRASCRARQQVRGPVVLAPRGRSGTLTRKRSLVQIQYGPPCKNRRSVHLLPARLAPSRRLPIAYVPAACPIAPPCPLRTLFNPAPQLALYEPVQAIGNRPLASITAVQIDQRGPRTAMTHPVHQLTQRGPCYRRQRVTRVVQIMKMRVGQASFGQRGIPHPAPEVAIPQRHASRAGKHERIGRAGSERRM